MGEHHGPYSSAHPPSCGFVLPLGRLPRPAASLKSQGLSLPPSPRRPSTPAHASRGAVRPSGHVAAGGRDLLGAQVVPRAAASGVFCSALVGGRMLGWSRLIFILLSGTVTCLVAQQVPPVGELEPRRRRGARRSMVGGRADEGQTGLDRPLAVSLQGSVYL